MSNKILKYSLLILLFAGLFTCGKEHKRVKAPFTFGKVGRKWTYEGIKIFNSYQDTLPINNLVLEITDKQGDLFVFSSSAQNWSRYRYCYIGSYFGYLNMNSLFIDTIVSCNSIQGQIYHQLPFPDFEYQKVDSIDVKLKYKGQEISCYKTTYVREDQADILYVHPKFGVVQIVNVQCPGGASCYRNVYTLVDTNF